MPGRGRHVTAPRRNARGLARRDAILTAALRIVGERGVGAVTHRAIAAEAGVPKAATTYYFDTLDDLLDAALRRFVAGEVGRVGAAADALASADAPDRPAVLESVLRAIGISPVEELAQFELYVEAARRPALRDAAAHCIGAYTELARVALERLGSPRAAEGATALVALLDGLALQRLLSSEPESFPLEVALPAALALVAAYAPTA